MSIHSLPPLLGDKDGRYRVHIVGNSGAGKTTTGRRLAKILNVPFISLDTLHWEPGWVSTPAPEFQQKVRTALAAPEAQNGWVIEGNYANRGGGLIAKAGSTDMIWLDPPFIIYFPRLVIRTFLRLFRLGEPCSPGCDERFSKTFFSKDSIIWWCITNHRRVQRKMSNRMQEIGIGVPGVQEQKMRRIGGWGYTGALERWFADVERMVRGR